MIQVISRFTVRFPALGLGWLAMAAPAAAAPGAGLENPVWQRGIQMGYSVGQHGKPWPGWKDPLANNNRAGFYIRQLRLGATVPFDSNFSGTVTGNLMTAEVEDAFLQARWGAYLFTAGKFMGAGLHTGTGFDEFHTVTIHKPLYTRLWSVYDRLFNFRDFGVQVERDFREGKVRNRFFLHNANLQNVIDDEPSFGSGAVTQALGLDYALDWRISPYTVIGGHAGAVADREWAEFLGNRKPWEVNYWFKTNPIVHGSLYHQMDFPRFHLLSEALLVSNRNVRIAPEFKPMKSWAVSSLLRLEHTPRLGSFYRYEFFDPSDGADRNDAVQLFTLGGLFRPSPAAHPGLILTAEYVRALEEGGRNLLSNDIAYLQLQMLF